MKKILSIFLIMTCVMVSLTGCGIFGKKEKKNETVAEDPKITAYKEALAELNTEMEDLKKVVAIYDDKIKTTDTFRNNEVVVSGSTSFNKIKDKIILEGEIYDEYGNISNTSSITLCKGITIQPNKTWNISLSTAESNFSNTNAYGTIKVKDYWNDVDVDFIVSEDITPFFEENGLKVREKRDIFIDENKKGEEASARIVIYDSTKAGKTYKVKFGDIMSEDEAEKYNATDDNEVDVVIQAGDKTIEATLKVGIIDTSNGLIEYMFVAEDRTAETLVDNLISSIQVGTKKIYLQ